MSTSDQIEILNRDAAMHHLDCENPVSNTGKAAEKSEKDERGLEKNKATYTDLSLWWFPFPLIAGAFGPMASAFTICAIIVPWRVWIAPEGPEKYRRYIDNPKWLIGVATTQLALAIVSNLFLYLNMARRVRFSIAQPIVISGWYLSSIILISIIVVAAKPIDSASPSNYKFTQAFYYAIFSACLYFFVATIMMVTVVGYYKGHYNREFKLTVSERTLMLQTIGFLFYLLCGAGVYARIEGWEYLDALYWADYTILTVGIGDIVPKTDLGRILLFPFAIGGITILGLIVCSVRSLVLERGKSIVSLRMTERQRLQGLKKIQKQSKKSPCHTERQRFKHEFELMRQIQYNAIRRRRWISLLVSSFVWFILWLLSAAVFRATEQVQSWSYLDSVYFAYVSLLTIGYGDFYPKSSSGKAFFVFWSLLAIPAITILVSNMGNTVVEEIRGLTLWIGNFTIFPGEGFVIAFRRAVRKVTKGKVFHNIEETPSDVLNHTNHRIQQPHSLEQESRSVKGVLLIPRVPPEREAGGSEFKHLPTRRKDRHCLLIKQIMMVMKHANSSPEKRYTFDEWEWYLKLLGEYESDVQAGGTLLGIPNLDRDGLTGTTNDGGNDVKRQELKKTVKWSWIGNRSPLTWNMEEPKWLLDRLTKTLQNELECERREGLEH